MAMADDRSDRIAREQAIDPARSCIVQAPAGSGKTGLLIQRYLRLLALADYPEEIIAVTFTRKAVAEMQDRVMQALAGGATGEAGDPQDPHQARTLGLAQQVLRRDRARGWQIRDNPTRLRIQTIDSLGAWLSRRMPVLSGLGAPPEITEDVQALYQQAALRTISHPWEGADARAVRTLLEHLDTDQPRTVRLLCAMLGKRNQWLRHAVRHHDRSLLEAILQEHVEEALGALAAAFPEALAGVLCRCLCYARKKLPEGSGRLLRGQPACARLPGRGVEDLAAWQAIREVLLTSQGQWRKRLNKNDGFPTERDGGDARMKATMSALLERLTEQGPLLEQLRAVAVLPVPHYQESEWQTVEALCRCLVLAEAQLRTVMAEHNRIDYVGMEQAALQALGEEQAPSDLGLYLDYRIRHLLVDEFQDVSFSQYHILRRLTAGWSAGDGRSLFLVGDPMQSIYGFREAELRCFLDTFDPDRRGHCGEQLPLQGRTSRGHFGEHLPLQSLQLSVNFRSAPEVISWVNDCFRQILPAADDPATGAVRHTSSQAADGAGAGGSVSLYPFFQDREGRGAGSAQRACEAEQLCRIVEQLQQRGPQDSIAILVRNRFHLAAIVPCLRDWQLPFRAVDIEGLLERSAIQDALALTRAWLHPADRIAWLAVLRAPWCGLDLARLHEISERAGQGTIWQALQEGDWQGSDGSDATLALQRLCSVFQEAMAQRQRLGLRESLERLWLRLGGPATLQDASDLENVQCFFDLVEQFDAGGGIERPVQFREQLETLFAGSDQQDDGQLQVMTIHKAKGLEFDHVILPGLGSGTRADDRDMLLSLPCPDRRDGPAVLPAPIEPAGGQPAPIYEYVRWLSSQKREREEQRLLYVAATRARRSLHLLGTARVEEGKNGAFSCHPPGRGSLLRHLWPVLEEQFNAELAQWAPGGAQAAPGPGGAVLFRLSPDWQLPAAPEPLRWRDQPAGGLSGETDEAAVEYSWVGAASRCAGTVVHRILQQQATTPEALAGWLARNRGRIEAMLLEQGVYREQLHEARQRVYQALEAMLQDERGRWLLDPGHREQHNEYALSGRVDGVLHNVIIDRSFVDAGGVRWVVDYKTGSHHGGDVQAFLDREQQRYQGQMSRYTRLMEALTGETVRAALYFPLLHGWREYPRR